MTWEKTDNQLKPCPLCGYFPDYKADRMSDNSLIDCDNCHFPALGHLSIKEWQALPRSNKKLFALAAELLDIAGDEFGNHGCNDFKLPDWSPSERRELAIDYERFNGDAEELERLQGLPEGSQEFEWFADFALMFYMAYKLRSMGRQA